MKTVLVILGTRPEAIKMCPLIKELKKRNNLSVKLMSTGQHKEMLDVVLKRENVEKDYDLSLMKIGQTLSYLTKEVLEGTERVIDELLPDFVLVHGDTTTAFAAALAAFYKKIPIGHVEAGLRTYDRENPYPEEFNRCAISKMASYHFAPTVYNKENLIKEGISEGQIFVTGNTVIDALKNDLAKNYTHKDLPRGDFAILTMHRRESIGKRMRDVFSAVKEIAEEKKIKIVYPIHKNEKILTLAESVFSHSVYVKTVPPLNPYDFHNFLSLCKFIITDSGGIQEEASFLGKPVLITRKCTERKELLSIGGIKLVGTDKNALVNEAIKIIDDAKYYKKISVPTSVFGNGKSSEIIADTVADLMSAKGV